MKKEKEQMGKGPMEFIAISFKGDNFNGGIVPAIKDLVAQGTINVEDVIFAKKEKDGSFAVLEISDLSPEVSAAFAPFVDTSKGGILSEADAENLADAIEPDSSVALMLFENAWAEELAREVEKANGRIIINEMIPARVIRKAAAGV